MNAIVGHERVPAEFLGKARALRNAIAIDIAGVNEALKVGWRPVHARLLRNPANPSVTLEHLTRLRRALEGAPGAAYRLGPVEFEGGCRKFCYRWHQLRPAHWSLDDWDENEHGLLISEISVTFDGSSLFEQSVSDIAVVGLHAIGRWYQRSFTQSVADLLTNMRPLVHVDPSIVRVPCPDGQWRCAPIKGDAYGTLLRVMTYVPS